jgi:hypothetical protein
VFVDGRSNASTDKQERSRVGNRMRGSYDREAVNPQSITVRMPCLRHRFSRMTIVRCLPCEVISCGTIQSRRTVWGMGGSCRAQESEEIVATLRMRVAVARSPLASHDSCGVRRVFGIASRHCMIGQRLKDEETNRLGDQHIATRRTRALRSLAVDSSEGRCRLPLCWRHIHDRFAEGRDWQERMNE